MCVFIPTLDLPMNLPHLPVENSQVQDGVSFLPHSANQHRVLLSPSLSSLSLPHLIQSAIW